MGKEIPVLFRPLRESVYPGYRGGNGFVENLSSYREGVRMRAEGVIRDEWLTFDIERHVEWDPTTYKLSPFTYSFMIDGLYPVIRFPILGRQSRPTIEEFTAIAERLPGFVLDTRITLEAHGLHTYRNPERNLFINWGKLDKHGRICIGVIQQEPVPELAMVMDAIVPYAVNIFNQLSPTRKIDQPVVERVIKTALECDKISPRCRI